MRSKSYLDFISIGFSIRSDMAYHEILTSIIESSLSLLSQISDEAYNRKEDPSRWSKKELLGHLIDSAYNNHQRFMRAARQDNLQFRGYAQDSWVQMNGYQQREPSEIIELWSSSNRHLAILISNLSEEVLSRRTIDHNFDKICMNLLQTKENTSLSYLIWDYIFHLEHHLVQLVPQYDRQLKEFTTY